MSDQGEPNHAGEGGTGADRAGGAARDEHGGREAGTPISGGNGDPARAGKTGEPADEAARVEHSKQPGDAARAEGGERPDEAAGAESPETAERAAGAPAPDPAADHPAADHPHPRPRRRIPRPARQAAAVLGPVLLTTAYFTVPFTALEPRHRVLAGVILAGLLALLALGMVVTTDRAMTDHSGRYPHPGLGILLLSWTAILVFAASYWAMATRHGQFVGLRTRLDALYFTGVTMATVGYGDIHPSGQLARAVVLVQLVYTFAFLVSGIAALRTRTRAKLARRMGG